MSRIGNKPVPIPSGVKAALNDGAIQVDGPKGKLDTTIPPLVSVAVTENEINVSRNEETKEAGAMQGLARSLIFNMVTGVTEGFSKQLQIVGVGYRAQASGQKLTLNLGFSHPVLYDIPEGIKVTITDNVRINVEGIDKQLVGEVAATIRRFRKPEPYKGKGIRYADEHISMKEGKTVA